MWFHGCVGEHSPGVELVIGWPTNFPHMTGGPAVGEPSEKLWVTSDAGLAYEYAGDVADLRGGTPRVYEVRPTGPLSDGGPDGSILDRTTTEPLVVIREVTDPDELTLSFE